MFLDSGLESDYLNWGDLNISPAYTESVQSISPPQQPASKHGNTGFSTMTLHSNTSNNSKQPRTLAPNLTRRSHKKSRAGCFTCKNRKIKCGEQKPKCTNCLSKGLDCHYPTVVESNSTSRHRSKDGSSPPTTTTTTTTTTLSKRSLGSPTGSGPSTSSFSMLDMRFFHHFLTTAYPHLPLGNDHVWLNDIPQFAESHPYLMHAILSLGASHLSRLTGVDYRKESLTHRGLAIAGLNQALSSSASSSSPPPPQVLDLSSSSSTSTSTSTSPSGSTTSTSHRQQQQQQQFQQQWGAPDAMLATCYSLTFQASYMGGPDGLTDFITMVRGCALTTAKIKSDDVPTAFNLQPNWHFKVMAPRLSHLPSVDRGLLEDGIAALEEILNEVFGLGGGANGVDSPKGDSVDDDEGMAQARRRRRNTANGGSAVGAIEEWEAHEVEANFCQRLIEVLEALLVSPSTGYLQFSGLYAVWYELSPSSFARFLSPTNLPSQLLLSYFVALQMLMVPLAVYEWPERAETAKARALTGTMEWADGIFERLLDEDNKTKTTRPLKKGGDATAGGNSGQWKWERYLRWPRRIMGIVGREISGDLSSEEERSLMMRMMKKTPMTTTTSKGLDIGVSVSMGMGMDAKDDDSGVSVLKLGFPISPAATEVGEMDLTAVDGHPQDDASLDASVVDMSVGVDVDESSLFEYWEPPPSSMFAAAGHVALDPGLITTMTMDVPQSSVRAIPTSTASAMNVPSIIGDMDLEMDML